MDWIGFFTAASGIAAIIWLLDYAGIIGFISSKTRQQDAMNRPRKPSMLLVMAGLLLLTWAVSLKAEADQSMFNGVVYRLTILTGALLIPIGLLLGYWPAIKHFPHWYAVILVSSVAVLITTPYTLDYGAFVNLICLFIVIAFVAEHFIGDSQALIARGSSLRSAGRTKDLS
jgi:hypothetical protein